MLLQELRIIFNGMNQQRTTRWRQFEEVSRTFLQIDILQNLINTLLLFLCRLSVKNRRTKSE